MARIDNLTNFLTDVASAIKTKKGDITNISAANFDTEILNLPSGGAGDVRLFDSISNMQSSTGNTDGQLAIVYASTMQNVTAESEFSSCTFPNTVVLSTAFTDNVYGNFRTVDESSGYFNGTVELSSSSFRFDGWGESGQVSVEYESQDGITYTRIDGGEELQEFGVTIKWEPMSEFNDAIGYFMQVGGSAFNGLYQYGNNTYSLARTQLDASSADVYSKTFYGGNGVEIGTMQSPECTNITELKTKVGVYNSLSDLNLIASNYDCEHVFGDNSTIKNIPSITITNANYFGTFCSNCSNLVSIGNINLPEADNVYYFFYNCVNLTDVGVFNIPNVTNILSMFYNCNNLSNSAYANITNFLPNANNLTHTKSLQAVGLNPINFTNDQLNVLHDKGYVDAIPMDTANWSNIYTIEYE